MITCFTCFGVVLRLGRAVAALCRAAWNCAVPRCVALRCAVLCRVALRCAALCRVALRGAADHLRIASVKPTGIGTGVFQTSVKSYNNQMAVVSLKEISALAL